MDALGGDDVGADLAVVGDDGGAGVVAGGLDGQDHGETSPRAPGEASPRGLVALRMLARGLASAALEYQAPMAYTTRRSGSTALGMSSRLPRSVAGVRHMITASSPLSW